MITIPNDPDRILTIVLCDLGIPYVETMGGDIAVQLDPDADGRLERLIGQLSSIRWQYQPGRAIQMELLSCS